MVGVAYGKSELATEERILLREEGGESAERECIVTIVLREGGRETCSGVN